MKHTNPFAKDIKVDTSKTKGKATQIAIPKAPKRNKGLEKIQSNLRKNARAYAKAQEKARDYAKELERKGFYISQSMKEIINKQAPDMITDKKLKEMKQIISLTRLKRSASYAVKEWEKVIYETDIDPSTGNKITRQIPFSSVAKIGDLDNPVLSDLSYTVAEQALKNPNKNSTRLASVLNSLLSYQRNNFKTVDGQLIQKVWILAKDVAQGIPTASNEYFSLRPYEENGKKKTFVYDPDPSKVKENMEAFYRSVHFKKLPNWALKKVEEITKHPQTSLELYEEFRKSSSLRGLAKNMAKLTQQASQQTGLPTQAVRVLMYLMETSQSWHIASRGTWDSDQVEANWIHIGRDLQMLEALANNRTNNNAIDKIVSGIMNAGRGVNVVSIMRETESILKKNRMAYRNAGSYFYDPQFDMHK